MTGYDIHTTLIAPRFPGQSTRQHATVTSTGHNTSVSSMMTKYGGQQWTAKCLTPGCNYTHTALTQDAATQAADQHTASKS
jgi:hypothetical protein